MARSQLAWLSRTTAGEAAQCLGGVNHPPAEVFWHAPAQRDLEFLRVVQAPCRMGNPFRIPVCEGWGWGLGLGLQDLAPWSRVRADLACGVPPPATPSRLVQLDPTRAGMEAATGTCLSGGSGVRSTKDLPRSDSNPSHDRSWRRALIDGLLRCVFLKLKQLFM